MSAAIRVISMATGLTETQADDVIIAAELATGMSFDSNASWEELPLGMGTDLIEFIQSNFYNRNLQLTYGEIAHAYLQYRLSKIC